MHRNTFLLVSGLGALLVVVIGIRVGSLFVPKQSPSVPVSPTTTPVPSPSPMTTLTYSNTTCGIAFDYPTTFTKFETETGAILGNPANTQESIVVTCQKEIPRVPLTDDKIETVAIGSTSGSLYHDASAKDGTPIDKLIFTHPTREIDVYIAGYGEIFSAILSTLRLLPER